MKKHLLAALLTGVLATAAHAADPTANTSFVEFTGTEVGSGAINSSSLFYIDEKTVGSEKSWYIGLEPKGSEVLSAVITFDSAITSVYFDQAGLLATDALYGKTGVTYDTAANDKIGLELSPRHDSYSFSGNQLTIYFEAANPGDHIRVLTQAAVVPEPSTNALLISGLFAVGFVAWRRKNG